MKNQLILFMILISLSSCKFYFRESRQLSDDYKYLNNNDFARKYFSLYDIRKGNCLESGRVYRMEQNNFTFKYIVFSKDNWVYDSPIMSTDISDNLKLDRNAFYTVIDSIIKIEWIAQSTGSVYTMINEGVIKNDTIFLLKEYTGKGNAQKEIIRLIKPNYNYRYYNIYDDVYIYKYDSLR